MASIDLNMPIRIPEIKKRIYRSLLKSEKEGRKPSKVDRMSSAGRCIRNRWAELNGIPIDKGKGFDAPVLSIFRLGNVIEDEVVELLKIGGYEITDTQRSVGEYPWVGHIDGVIKWKPDGFEEISSLLEVKSSNSRNFERLRDLGYEKWSPSYYAQIQSYMGHMPDVEDAIVFVYNKDTSEFFIERIFEDKDHFDYLRLQSIMVTQSETLLERPDQATSPKSQFCRWCDRSDWCWDPATDVEFDE